MTPLRGSSITAVLEFWFGKLHDGFADDAHRQRWFNGGSAMDDAIRDRFQHLVTTAQNGELTSWLDEARGRLAFILVCDQFPRNVFRGQSEAFSFDELALSACKEGVDLGVDRLLEYDERTFFYFPLEHSEQLTDQHACVDLFTSLRDDTPSAKKQHVGTYLHHAHQHRDIIEKFGRFPHRNAVLGRTSTAEETAFVAGGTGFGQTPR